MKIAYLHYLEHSWWIKFFEKINKNRELTENNSVGSNLKTSPTCRCDRTWDLKIGWSLQNPPACGVVWALYPIIYPAYKMFDGVSTVQ